MFTFFPQVILNLNEVVSIASSAVIALGYTLLGGLISVAYTDVIQIFFIVFAQTVLCGHAPQPTPFGHN